MSETLSPTSSVTSPPPRTAAPLLRVRGLRKVYQTKLPGWRQRFKDFVAVDDASFDLRRGETMGIVGESGSGKTTLARCALRAVTPTAGEVIFDDGKNPPVDLATLDPAALKPLRQDMQMIFQDPFSSLNPRMNVLDLVSEPLLIHGLGNRADRRRRVIEILERVGLGEEHLTRYPHAFSGGQRQRIGIARALLMKPKLVVADEAVSALDVTVQAQVLDLLKEFQQEMQLTYLFVSHDLSVVREVCDRILVMYRGKIVEAGDAADVFDRPRHPYTRVLLSAIPHPDPDTKLEPLSLSDFSEEELRPLPDVTEVLTRPATAETESPVAVAP